VLADGDLAKLLPDQADAAYADLIAEQGETLGKRAVERRRHQVAAVYAIRDAAVSKSTRKPGGQSCADAP